VSFFSRVNYGAIITQRLLHKDDRDESAAGSACKRHISGDDRKNRQCLCTFIFPSLFNIQASIEATNGSRSTRVASPNNRICKRQSARLRVRLLFPSAELPLDPSLSLCKGLCKGRPRWLIPLQLSRDFSRNGIFHPGKFQIGEQSAGNSPCTRSRPSLSLPPDPAISHKPSRS